MNDENQKPAEVPAPAADDRRFDPQATDSGVSRPRWWIHFVLIGGYFTPLLFLRRPAGPALTHTPQGLIFVCLIDLLFFTIVFGLAWLASRATREQLLLRWRPGFWVIPLGVAYSIGIRVAVVLIAIAVTVVLLATGLDQQQVNQFWRSSQPDVTSMVSITAARSDPAYAWLLLTLVSFVSAGLREELWRAGTLAGMRALWPKAFGSGNGQLLAIVIIAIAFGLGHLRLGVLGATVAGLLGFLLGLIMIIHRSIWPAVIAHGSFDALTFAILSWLPATAHPLH